MTAGATMSISVGITLLLYNIHILQIFNMGTSEASSYAKEFDRKTYLQLYYTAVQGNPDEKGATLF